MAIRRAALSVLFLIASFSLCLAAQDLPPQAAAPGQQAPGLRERALRDGQVRVIVELRLPSGSHMPEGLANAAAVNAQRQGVAEARGRVLTQLRGLSHRVTREYVTVPYIALEVSAEALDSLTAAADVVRVMEDALVRPVLSESAPLIEADQVWSVGYDGTGNTVAVLDSGVDAFHPFLAGKVVEEACFSTTDAGISQSLCPNGQAQQFGAGAAAPCGISGCEHGTHVAGIAAGTGPSFSGVAKGAQLMAVQVFSEVTDAATCGGIAPCVGGYTSDVIAALERVYSVAASRHIVSVNMSLGEGSYTAPCDTQPYKPIIDNLRSIGVATVVASGNSGTRTSLSSPACISSAVSVGSSDRNDQISSFSNVASFLSLLAPGDSIVSSIPGGDFEAFSGTSMAAPHVAGAWAALRQAVPTASVTTILGALRQTGLPIKDNRSRGTVTVPRVRMLRALATLIPVTNPAPSITAVTPATVKVGSGVNTLTVTGSGFNTFSVVRWNGSPRTTTVLSTTRIRGTLTSADVSALGIGNVSVSTPAPGGGTSISLPVPIEPPPALTVSGTTVAPGAQVTVTLTRGYGGELDWIALAAKNASNTNYLNWTYVGAGVYDFTWTVAMPSTAGNYEFRLFRDNGYTRAATSPTVTVDTSFSPAPVVTALSPDRTLAGGSAFTLTVTGSNFTSASVVRWNGSNRTTTFVSSSQLQAAIAASDVATAGTAQVTVSTPSPGGGTSGALPFTIAPPAIITVSATNVIPGGTVTATLSNGLGGASDWLALAATSAPNTSYIQYIFLGAGVTTRAWTVTVPTTPGTYEFRLFPNNGYVRAATSPTVTVAVGPNPVPVIASTAPSSVVANSGAFTLTVQGSGFVSSSVVRWNGSNRPTTYISGTELRAAVGADDIASVGTAQLSVFSPSPGGGVSAAVPFSITTSATGQATLAVSSTNVGPGQTISVTLTDGYGGSTDWLALAATSAPNGSYISYVYVGAGVTNKTFAFTMPSTPGTYEFRLFLNNGYVRGATSPTITVGVGGGGGGGGSGTAPQLTVSATSATPGSQVTVTLTGGYGGATDWIALAATAAPDTSYLQYVYVGSGVTTRTWTVTLPTSPGTYEFRLFLNNGYTRAATSPAIVVGSQ